MVFLAYILVWLSGKKISYREFKNRCCDPQEILVRKEISTKIFQFIDGDKISFLLRKNDSMIARRHLLDKKAGNLLTLTSILIGLLATFSSVKPPGILFVIPFVLLFCKYIHSHYIF
ncbi:hypothetical protein HRE53_33140 (plasmid) [Acaryochloris sp. 'Moss Beach']|uniref:hypothetical protein n=1 Tax=Acaryochloris sp. 'Moss Beach' TaxID=2740837 RepID=UPI001F358260|nr:hypothetical protein [Acaryochloris sp. 'Moss Beach']UJB73459.1 hypothetical protein HRE53_33140 [Acaryochloris sp. 'Moss Beach']